MEGEVESFEVVFFRSKGEFSILSNGTSSKTCDAEQVADELWKWLEIKR